MLKLSRDTIIIGLLLLIVAIPIMFISEILTVHQTLWFEVFTILILFQYQSFKEIKHGNRN